LDTVSKQAQEEQLKYCITLYFSMPVGGRFLPAILSIIIRERKKITSTGAGRKSIRVVVGKK
jgi:hypothetical protein